MKEVMDWLRSEESGQGMVEYGLILALIAVAAIIALIAIGGKVGNIFNKASTEMNKVNTT